MGTRVAKILFLMIVLISFSSTVSAQDMHIELAGRWPNGPCHAVCAAGHIAYVGNGAKLDILDISDTSDPDRIGQIMLPGFIHDIAVYNQVAYVAAGRAGLRIVNVSNPLSAVEVGSVLADMPVSGVSIRNDSAFVCAGNQGLYIFDMHVPSAPVQLDHVEAGGALWKVLVHGNYAYTAARESGFSIFRLQPEDLQMVSYIAGVRAWHAAIVDTIVYLADENNGITLYDISDPEAPVFIRNYSTLVSARDIAVRDGYAYLAAKSDGLLILDVRNPYAIDAVGQYDTEGSARRVFLVNGSILIADDFGGCQFVDVSHAKSPGMIADLSIGGQARGIDAKQDIAYMAYGTSGLQIVDLVDPESPFVRGSLLTVGHARDIQVNGGIAYIAAGDSGLQIVQVPANSSDLTVPAKLGAYTAVHYTQGVHVGSPYTYIADGDSGLQIINTEVSSAPVQTGSLVLDGYAVDVSVSGIYAYVGIDDIGYSGLNVVDIAAPAAPERVGGLNLGGQAARLVVSGQYVYIADRIQGLRIVDVSIPGLPSERGSFSFSGAENITVVNQTGYMVGNAEMVILDLSDPDQPEEIQRFEIINAGMMGVDVVSDTAFVAYNDGIAFQGRLQIVDVNGVGVPESLSAYATGFPVLDFDVDEDTVYVAAAGAQLQIIDFNNFENPLLLGGAGSGDHDQHVVYRNGYAYITEANRFRVFDVSSPSAASEIDNLTFEPEIYDFTVNSQYAYLVAYTSWSSENGLRIVNVTNPNTIYETGFYGFDIEGDSVSIAYSSSRVYITDDYGLHIFNVSNPDNPVPEGLKSSIGKNRTVAVSENYLFMGDVSGLEIIDISNHSAPVTLYEMSTSDPITDITLDGQYCYLVLQDKGVQILDVSSPGAPVVIDSLDTGLESSLIKISGRHGYVGKGNQGFAFLDLPTVLKWSPAQVNYDTLLVGQDSTLSVSLINPHQSVCSIQNIAVLGPRSGEITISGLTLPSEIAANDSLPFSVQYTPASEGVNETTLIVYSNYDSSPDTIPVYGTAIKPVLSVSDTLIDFHVVLTNQTAIDSFYIKNSGSSELQTGPLSLTGADSAYFTVDTVRVVLAPADSQFIPVMFAPDAPGSYQAVIHISSNGGDSTITLEGIGSDQLLTVEPLTVVFSNTLTGQSSTDSVLLKNEGLAAIQIDTILIAGTDSSRFSVNSSSFSMLPSDSQYVPVQFLPDTVHLFSGLLLIQSTSPTSPDTVRLYGNGINSGYVIIPDTLDFGYVFTGDTVTDFINIHNIGDVDVQVDSIFITGRDSTHFAVDTNGFILAGGDSTNLAVQFSPDTTAAYNARLHIYMNGSTDPDTVYLSGNGSMATLAVSQAQIIFDQTVIGTTITDSFFVANTGEENILMHVPFLEGTDTEPFHADSTSFTLEPGDTVAMHVSFSPDSARLYTARLVLRSNAVSNPDTVMLYGTGVHQMLAVTIDTALIDTDVTVRTVLPSSIPPKSAYLYYRQGGETTYHTVVMAQTDTVLTGLIPADSVTIRGIEYYIRVAYDHSELTHPLVNPSQNPDTQPVHFSRYHPGLTIPDMTYRMISVPLILSAASVDSVLTDDYGTYDIKKWRIARYDPESGEYNEYPLLTHDMDPGIAFWLITRTGSGFDVGRGQSVDTDAPYPVSVAPGWNQLSNPFPFSVHTDSMMVPDGVELPVWYNGSDYEYQVEVMNPWDGYFVNNLNDDTVQVMVYPSETPALNAKQIASAENQTGEYILKFRASIPNTSLFDGQNYIGMKKNSSDGWDANDFSEAPPIGDYVRLSIIENQRRCAGCFKSIREDGQVWEMEVTSSMENEHDVTVQYDETGAMPDNMSLYIIDISDGCILELTDNRFQIHLNKKNRIRTFRVIVGTEAFAEKFADGIPLVPLVYKLGQNYPNPFNPETVIPYQLARQGHVTIGVYNIIGHRVCILIDSDQTVGEHQVVWDGRDITGQSVAAGVYFYQIQAGSFKATKKMVLIR